MAEFKLDHPLGRDIEVLHGAMLAGMADQTDLFTGKTKVEFVDAINSKRGVSKLTIESLVTRNVTTIELPLQVEEDDREWLVTSNGGAVAVAQRINIKRLGNDLFTVALGKGTEEAITVATPFLQFDIVQEGVLFSVDVNGNGFGCYGEYDDQIYANYASLVRKQASIGELLILAGAI